MNAINPTRHLSVFSPTKFGDARVDVIGVGATGSHIAYALAKLGISNLHVWDFDDVEDHNLANQMYGPRDVGISKVDAISRLIVEQTGLKVTGHNQKLEAGHKDLGEIVFLLVDSMKARKEIAEQCIHMNFRTKLLIETRMGTETGMIYTIDLGNGLDFKEWQKTLHSDEEVVETSACGARTTVGATAMRIASDAVWQMLYWLKEGKIENHELIFSLRPPLIMPTKFGVKKEVAAAAA